MVTGHFSRSRAMQALGARLSLAVAALLWIVNSALASERLVTIERFVPHVSTLPANAGQTVGLYLREKLDAELMASMAEGMSAAGRVILFVHGNSVPAVPDFDLPYEDYSWMAYLAEAGFDTFAMDHSGYGHSPRPALDDPCNMSEADQALLSQAVKEAPCAPSYPYRLNNSQSDWDEIATVVDYLLALRDVERISLIGWSRGGPRVGGFAARHPDKVDKLILYAPAYQALQSSEPPERVPGSGVPMTLQTREALMHDRWQSGVACDGQVDPEIRDVIWQSIMSFDSLGSVWRPGGVMRVRLADYWGWNREFASRIQAPSLILVGREDGLLPAAEALYDDLSAASGKVLITMECSTHFSVWEATQYRFMHEASKNWLLRGEFQGERQGRFIQEAAR